MKGKLGAVPDVHTVQNRVKFHCIQCAYSAEFSDCTNSQNFCPIFRSCLIKFPSNAYCDYFNECIYSRNLWIVCKQQIIH